MPTAATSLEGIDYAYPLNVFISFSNTPGEREGIVLRARSGDDYASTLDDPPRWHTFREPARSAEETIDGLAEALAWSWTHAHGLRVVWGTGAVHAVKFAPSADEEASVNVLMPGRCSPELFSSAAAFSPNGDCVARVSRHLNDTHDIEILDLQNRRALTVMEDAFIARLSLR